MNIANICGIQHMGVYKFWRSNYKFIVLLFKSNSKLKNMAILILNDNLWFEMLTLESGAKDWNNRHLKLR